MASYLRRTWGAADFIGGLASKRTSPYRILFLAEIAGLIPFTALALLLHEPIPPAADMLLGAGSSLLGLTGLLLLYRALADGQMTIAAPVSALFAALIPVIFGFFSLGAPSTDHPDRFRTRLPGSLAHFANGYGELALSASADLRLPLLSGFFFGLYFIIIHQATLNAFFWPLVAARCAGFVAFGTLCIDRTPTCHATA